MNDTAKVLLLKVRKGTTGSPMVVAEGAIQAVTRTTRDLRWITYVEVDVVASGERLALRRFLSGGDWSIQ